MAETGTGKAAEMSESIWCDVQLTIPRQWMPIADGVNHLVVPWFVEDLGVALINGDTMVVDEDERKLVIEINGEGNYGFADDDVAAALAEIERLGISYRASSDAKYEMAGELYVFNGVSGETTNFEYGNEDVTMSKSTFERIVASDVTLDDAVDLLRAYFEGGQVNPLTFAVDHLSTECPEREVCE